MYTLWSLLKKIERRGDRFIAVWLSELMIKQMLELILPLRLPLYLTRQGHSA